MILAFICGLAVAAEIKAPSTPEEVAALLEIFRGRPEAREEVLGALERLGPGTGPMEHVFLQYFDDQKPEAQIFAVRGALAQRDEKALVSLHELAHRRFEAKAEADLPAGPERDRWRAQYEALAALARWEGPETMERLRQRVRQAPAVARIMASALWKETLPDLAAWSAAGDRERLREALSAPVPRAQLEASRAEMKKMIDDPSLAEDLRRALAAKLADPGEDRWALCLAVARRDPAPCGAPGIDGDACRNFYRRARLSMAFISHDPGARKLCRALKADSGEKPFSEEDNAALCDLLLSAEKKPVKPVCARMIKIYGKYKKGGAEAEGTAPCETGLFGIPSFWGRGEPCKASDSDGAYQQDACLLSLATAGYRKGSCPADSPLCAAMLGKADACR